MQKSPVLGCLDPRSGNSKVGNKLIISYFSQKFDPSNTCFHLPSSSKSEMALALSGLPAGFAQTCDTSSEWSNSKATSSVPPLLLTVVMLEPTLRLLCEICFFIWGVSKVVLLCQELLDLHQKLPFHGVCKERWDNSCLMIKRRHTDLILNHI